MRGIIEENAVKWRKWLENWDMTGLKINATFLEMEWQPQVADKQAAWDLYVELLTRIATQPLSLTDGDESAALASIYQLFPLTREILKNRGYNCMEFAKISIVMLNQIVRPFTAFWHRESLAGAFNSSVKCARFRKELIELQSKLRTYAFMLSDMAGVENNLLDMEKHTC
jgi:hypothetical protein